MTNKKWALRPGEKMLEAGYRTLHKSKLDKQYNKLVEDYLEQADKRPITLNDSKEVVFFITYKESFTFDKVDVAVYDGYDYVFMPPALAQKLSKAYLYYVDTMAEAYDYIEAQEDDEE